MLKGSSKLKNALCLRQVEPVFKKTYVIRSWAYWNANYRLPKPLEQHRTVCTTQAFYRQLQFCENEEAYNKDHEFKEKCDNGDISLNSQLCRQCEAGTEQTGNAAVSDDWWRCDNGICIEKVDYNKSIFVDGNRQVWTLTHFYFV